MTNEAIRQGSGQLTGKVAIVTGASSGFGLAISKTLLAHGAVVYGADVAPSRDTTRPVKALDVTNQLDWSRLVDEVVAESAGINILVNNAGISGAGNDPYDIDSWRKILDVNLTGAFLGCAAVIPLMQANGGGSIINVSSIAALQGSARGNPAYHASKGGLRSLSKAIAARHAPAGVRCNTIHPGWMPPMGGSDGTRDVSGLGIPLNRGGTAEDVANLVAFLASPNADYITGTDIPVDGGITNTYIDSPQALTPK